MTTRISVFDSPRPTFLLTPLAIALTLLLALLPSLVHAQTREGVQGTAVARAEHLARVKAIQLELMREGTKRKFAAARKDAQARAEAKRLGRPMPKASTRAKAAPPDIETAATRATDRLPRTGVQGALVTPANVKANVSAGDTPNATQSETAIAAWGDFVLTAWNDGQGSATGGAYQGYATSSDGGATFTDGGDPPKPGAYPAFRWTSDPIVTVNENTGVFYYCGLASTDATHNAIAVARGHFTGGVFGWDGVVVAREVLNTAAFLDKQWMAADSATGNVYVTNTTFLPGGNQIDLQRSVDGGATWLPAVTLSSVLDNGYVQGSRVVLGPAGDVWTTWSAIGQSTAEDWLRVRRSQDGGLTFGSEATAVGYIANFGTGSPGFNRERGIHFPSLAVDRTAGTHRGRAYVTWNESYNFQDDLFGGGVNRVEVEANETPATATPFAPGDVLRGTTSAVSPADLDYWSVSLAAGQKIIVWADSLTASQTYTLRMFAPAPDGGQRLAFGGDVNAGTGVGQAFYTYVAPVAGTYYLRFAPAYTSTDSKIGPYRVTTAVGVSGGERGRDQRDVFVTWSDDAATWATPVRVNDDAVGLDDYLPEVTVGADGLPWISWLDHRDDPFGSRSNQYLSRSSDGGATWAPGQRLTSVTSNWTTVLSNLAPNLGDYAHAWSDARWVHPVWADGRDGSPDVYTTRIDALHSIQACASDTSAPANASVTLSWIVRNDNPLFANGLTATLQSERGWTMPAAAGVTVPAGGTAIVPLTVAIPDTAAPGVQALKLELTNATGSVTRTCIALLDVTGSVAVGGGGGLAFALQPSVPNPARGAARIGFTLPRAGRVSLAIYGVRGERVRTLIDGERGAGAHAIVWDGRDDRGRAVGAGTYFYRLEGLGQRATQRVVWMR